MATTIEMQGNVTGTSSPTNSDFKDMGAKISLTGISKGMQRRTDRPLSPLGCAFNFVVLMVGTAIVTTPHSFSLTTPILGIVVEIVLGFTAWMSAVCIFNAASISNATSFIDLGKRVFGTTTQGHVLTTIFITFPNVILIIGVLGGYTIIASSTFEAYVNIDYRLMRAIMAFIIFSFGIIKSFNATKYVSYCCFFAFLLIVIFMLVVTFQFYGLIDYDEKPFNFSNFVQALPILGLGLNGHIVLPGMAAEMKKSKHSITQYYLLGGQITVALFNSIVGYFPAVMFGSEIEGDVMTQLNNVYQEYYNTFSPLLLAANIMLSAAVIVQSPLLVIPLKEIIMDRNGYSVRERSYFQNTVISFFIAFVSGAIAIGIPNLIDALNTFSAIGALMILGPTAAILSFWTEVTTWSKVRSYSILVVGIMLIICNIYVIYLTYSG